MARAAVEACARASLRIQRIVEGVEIFAPAMAGRAVAACARTGARCSVRIRRIVGNVGTCAGRERFANTALALWGTNIQLSWTTINEFVVAAGCGRNAFDLLWRFRKSIYAFVFITPAHRLQKC
jgi:hypothetical protein